MTKAVGPARRLREERRQREATRALLAECRRGLSEALAAPLPDLAAVLELSTEEQLLVERLTARSLPAPAAEERIR